MVSSKLEKNRLFLVTHNLKEHVAMVRRNHLYGNFFVILQKPWKETPRILPGNQRADYLQPSIRITKSL